MLIDYYEVNSLMRLILIVYKIDEFVDDEVLKEWRIYEFCYVEEEK